MAAVARPTDLFDLADVNRDGLVTIEEFASLYPEGPERQAAINAAMAIASQPTMQPASSASQLVKSSSFVGATQTTLQPPMTNISYAAPPVKSSSFVGGPQTTLQPPMTNLSLAGPLATTLQPPKTDLSLSSTAATPSMSFPPPPVPSAPIEPTTIIPSMYRNAIPTAATPSMSFPPPPVPSAPFEPTTIIPSMIGAQPPSTPTPVAPDGNVPVDQVVGMYRNATPAAAIPSMSFPPPPVPSAPFEPTTIIPSMIGAPPPSTPTPVAPGGNVPVDQVVGMYRNPTPAAAIPSMSFPSPVPSEPFEPTTIIPSMIVAPPPSAPTAVAPDGNVPMNQVVGMYRNATPTAATPSMSFPPPPVPSAPFEPTTIIPSMTGAPPPSTPTPVAPDGNVPVNQVVGSTPVTSASPVNAPRVVSFAQAPASLSQVQQTSGPPLTPIMPPHASVGQANQQDLFDVLDRNHNGYITRDEFIAAGGAGLIQQSVPHVTAMMQQTGQSQPTGMASEQMTGQSQAPAMPGQDKIPQLDAGPIATSQDAMQTTTEKIYAPYLLKREYVDDPTHMNMKVYRDRLRAQQEYENCPIA